MSCNNDCNCGSCCPGPQGDKGENGNQGIRGITGARGIQGIQGIPGTSAGKGDDGDDGFGYNSSSADTIIILDTAGATVNFTIDSEKAYTPGARVRVSDTSNPTVNYFEGIVTAYNDATGAITVASIDLKEGSGAYSAWNINLAGDVGATGDQGIPGFGTNGIDGFGYNSSTVDSIDVLITAATIANFTIDDKKAYTPGARVRVSDSANPTVNYFEGIVISYDDGTGAITVDTIDLKAGTGTYSSWNINLAGEIGTAGGGDYKALFASSPTGASIIGSAGADTFEDLVTINIPAGTLGSLSGLRFKFTGKLSPQVVGEEKGLEVRINGIPYTSYTENTLPGDFIVEFQIMMDTVVSANTNISSNIMLDKAFPQLDGASLVTGGINDWSVAANDIILAGFGENANDVLIRHWSVEKLYF